MTICDRCQNEIGEDRKHEPDISEGVCIVYQKMISAFQADRDNWVRTGWVRRRPIEQKEDKEKHPAEDNE